VAQSFIAVVGGNVDTFQVPSNHHRQAVALGDPGSDAGVAPVDATKGLGVWQAEPVIAIRKFSTGGSGSAQNVLTSGCYVKAVRIDNDDGSKAYAKLYDTSGTPTAGSGTPLISEGCQASLSRDLVFAGRGIQFTTGVGLTITQGMLNADVANPTVDLVKVTVEYAT
jgi:hypothetical protein